MSFLEYLCGVKHLLLLLAVVMLTKPLWPVMDYIANYNFIVKELCVNRDKPEMNCNGKCYLAKQLAKESAEGENNPINNKTSKTEIPQIIIFETISEFHFYSLQSETSLNGIAYRPNLITSLFNSKILHPPRVG